MLRFKQTEISTNIIVTLTELVTLGQPYYLFVFTHVTTKATVFFVKTPADDLSTHKQRYNEFEISPSVLFLNKDVGEWHYRIYEVENGSVFDSTFDETFGSTIPVGTRGLLERGKMILERHTEFTYTMYDEPVAFKTYNG